MIVVTGAAGRLGRRVVQRLIGKGYDVLGTDRVPHSESPSPFVLVDLCNAENTTELLTDAEAVIHMGAIPGPRGDTPHEVSENNIQSTFNVLWAAAEKKLRRGCFPPVPSPWAGRMIRAPLCLCTCPSTRNIR